jgi:hypothetical protein
MGSMALIELKHHRIFFDKTSASGLSLQDGLIGWILLT